MSREEGQINAARSHTLLKRLVISVSAVALFTATGPPPQLKRTPDLFTRVETLTLSDGTPAVGTVALSGDTAVVGADGVAHVFERPPGSDHWVHIATLAPSDGTSGFGVSVATDGKTIVVGANPFVVGAEGAVFVFQRTRGRAWQELARLTGDVNAPSFGRSVGVSGPTVVVGAPTPNFFVQGGEYHQSWDLGSCTYSSRKTAARIPGLRSRG